MSKSLNEEYKKLAQTEIPDLWDKIEPQLTDKSAPAEEVSEKKKSKYRHFYYIGTTVAALICGTVLIYAVWMLNGRFQRNDKHFYKNSSMEQGTAYSESAAEVELDAPSVEEYYDSAADSMDEQTADGMQDSMEEVKESSKDKLDVAAEDKLNAAAGETEKMTEQSDSAEELLQSAVTPRLIKAVKEDMQDALSGVKSGSYLEDIQIIITACTEIEGEMVYLAAVVKDSNDIWEEGSQIVFGVTAGDEVQMMTEYQADFFYDSDYEFYLKIF